jgi:hypothetical protein
MKSLFLIISLATVLSAGIARGEPVRDWHNLHNAHLKIHEVLKDMTRAQAANHYDMGGHAAKAEELLRHAE